MLPGYGLIISTDKKNHFQTVMMFAYFKLGIFVWSKFLIIFRHFFHLHLSYQHQGLANKMFMPTLFF